jgi:hypothetical protein
VDHPLAAHFPTVTSHPVTHDPADDLRDFVATHHDGIVALVRTRATQTNSIERSNALVVMLGLLDDEAGPLGLVDLGTSAGGNLLVDHWTHVWHTRDGIVRVPGSPSVDPPVTVTSRVAGPAPLPARQPRIAWRLGLDQAPVDPSDPDQVRWLQACVWPSDLARFQRLGRALEVVAHHRPAVRAGDVTTDLPEVLAAVPTGLHPTLTSSWVLNYLATEDQRELLATLDRIGATRDLSLVTFESPARTPGLGTTPADLGATDDTVLGWYRWRAGRRRVDHVATAHAHARWIRWWPDAVTA